MDDLLGTLAVAALFNKFAAWVFAITLTVLAIGYAGYAFGFNAAHDEGLQRGFVEFCKSDGRQVWKGECDNG
ncbi:MAG: hypothetical protein ACRBB0_05145 [Pelagimonas sp.]|uniref:hypothetical protein n=1 Tax=Pelagimonas sp. TaxID=2073170 RepID=UPI003D6C610F